MIYLLSSIQRKHQPNISVRLKSNLNLYSSLSKMPKGITFIPYCNTNYNLISPFLIKVFAWLIPDFLFFFKTCRTLNNLNGLVLLVFSSLSQIYSSLFQEYPSPFNSLLCLFHCFDFYNKGQEPRE